MGVGVVLEVGGKDEAVLVWDTEGVSADGVALEGEGDEISDDGPSVDDDGVKDGGDEIVEDGDTDADGCTEREGALCAGVEEENIVLDDDA